MAPKIKFKKKTSKTKFKSPKTPKQSKFKSSSNNAKIEPHAKSEAISPYLTEKSKLELGDWIVPSNESKDHTTTDLIIIPPSEAGNVFTHKSNVVGDHNKANMLVSKLKCQIIK